jgi:hypothetical protein
MCGDKRLPFRDSCFHASRPFGKVSFDGGKTTPVCLGTAVAQTTYTVTDLGTLGGTFGGAEGHE